MSKLIRTSLIVLAAAVLVAGCGGSDSTLSTAEFLKKADKICSDAHDKSFKSFTAYVVKNGKNLTNSQPSQALLGEAVVAVSIPALREGVKKLEELDASGDDKEKLETFIASLEKTNKEVEENPKSKQVASGAIYYKPNAVAFKYDLGRCSRFP